MVEICSVTRKRATRKDNDYRGKRMAVRVKCKGYYPAGNYMFKVNNRNTRTRCEICSKLTIKTPERRH